MNDNITKLNKVIESLENNIEVRNNLNYLDKKTIADTKKKIKALEKLEAKERAILGDLYDEPFYDERLDCGCNEYDCRQSDIPVID